MSSKPPNVFFNAITAGIIAIQAGLALVATGATINATWVSSQNGNWNDTSNWSTDPTTPNNGGDQFNVFIDSGDDQNDVTVTLNLSLTINTLTIDEGDILVVPVNRSLTIVNGLIANSGQIEQNSSGFNFQAADLKIEGDTTLTGSGTVAMSDHRGNRIYSSTSTDVLTQEADHTIAGAGQLGFNSMGFVNNGLVDANQPNNPLVIDPSDAGVTNNSILQSSSEGILRLQGGTFTNNSTIQALDDSVVELAAGSKIVGGTFSSAGTGVLRINVDNNTTFIGTITNNATIEQNSSGFNFNAADLKIEGDTTLTGSGTVAMSDHRGNRIYSSTSTDVLTQEANHTIAGAGQLGLNGMGFINNGLVDANHPNNPLVIDPSSKDLDGLGANVLNENGGVFQASGTGELRLGGGNFVNRNNGLVRVESKITVLSGGHLDNQPGGIIRGTGTLDVSAGSFTNGGTIAPGFSAGILTVVGNVPQTSSGELEIELFGTTLGDEYDQLAVNGNVTLDGFLDLDRNFAPAFGDVFTIINATFDSANGVEGEFRNAPRSDPVFRFPEGGTFDVVYSAQTVVLTGFRETDPFDPTAFVDVDPRATYLRAAAEPQPYPVDAEKIDLASVIPGHPIKPGDWIELERFGEFLFTQADCNNVSDQGPHGDCTLRNLDAVFSGSDILLPDDEAMQGNKEDPIPPGSNDPPFSRVPDAIAFEEGDADLVFTSPDPFDNDAQLQLSDIPEDFTIDLEGDLLNPDSVLIKVPEGATHLFLGAGDSQWADNSLTEDINRFGVQITLVNAPGDFDGDGDVDGADFLKWQRGESPNPLSAVDLDRWETSIGEGGNAQNIASTGVPEPSAGLMLILAIVISLSRHRTIRVIGNLS